MITFNDAQYVHDGRKFAVRPGEHDDSSCWCCCTDCEDLHDVVEPTAAGWFVWTLGEHAPMLTSSSGRAYPAVYTTREKAIRAFGAENVERMCASVYRVVVDN